MGTRGLKICKCCRKAFEPQLTDAEIASLWFTEQELEMDQEHFEQTGHSHLQAPVQELCDKCSMNPDLEAQHNPFTGRTMYRIRQKMKKLKVENKNVHQVTTSSGIPLTIEGTLPPQEIIDIIAGEIMQGKVEGNVAPKKVVKKLISKKRPWWRFWK